MIDTETLLSIVTVAVLLILGFTVGRMRERAHIASLERRERENADILVSNLRTPTNPERIERVGLVCGEMVVATDYFKTFVSGYRKLFGGEMRSYESLATRARREAVLRMVEQARQAGATEVWNVRVETANIGGIQQQAGAVMCEVFAYGTAVIRRRADGQA